MGLNDTPSSERIHIGFFGRTNAGKSSLVNRITDQDLAIVSDTKGTTTDPVYKAMEILPLGPVVIIDTPGFDDDGILGEKRISRTKLVLNKTDVAVLVVDLSDGIRKTDEELISLFEEKGIPYIIAFNKADLKEGGLAVKSNEICVSSVTGENINRLKEMIAAAGLSKPAATPLISDLIEPGDTVVLVIPIDSSAPKGRIILPQQQVLREILDSHALAYIAQDTDLKELLDNLKTKPKLVVTDSQAFGKVSKTVPEDIMLTSFSILLARHKGFLESAVKGVKAIESLENGISIYSPARALFMLLTAQNLPHMEHVSSCSGALESRMAFAVSGSIEHSHWVIPVESSSGIRHLVVDVHGMRDLLSRYRQHEPRSLMRLCPALRHRHWEAPGALRE